MKKEITLNYEVLTLDDLSQDELRLRKAAFVATAGAYAPYSDFHVGAALLLSNGELVTASNKENASFPAGVCAERNALNYAHDHFPHQVIKALAIIADTNRFEFNEPIAPCGICRQVMCETERVQQSAIQVYLHGQGGEVVKLSSAADLLPFHFYLKELKK